MSARRRPAGRLLLLVLLAGCASANPNYYTLEREPGPARRTAARLVSVRSAAIPRYLERNEIVRSTGGGRVRVASNDWWGEPLRNMVQRVMAADLAQRLPNDTVLGTEALGGEGASVQLAVERFEPAGDGTLALDGQLAVERGDGRVLRTVAVRVPCGCGGAEEQVLAMSRALGEAADLAARLLSGPEPPAAPFAPAQP